jgi:hypothetical protein
MNADDLWAAYTRLQEILDSTRISDRYWAIEETMNIVLGAIAEDRELSPIQIDNLISNRSAKYRRRRRYQDEPAAPVFSDGSGSAEASIELRSRLSRCSVRDQSILIAIGHGVTTREMALGYVVPEGTIKTWVRRARLKFAA